MKLVLFLFVVATPCFAAHESLFPAERQLQPGLLKKLEEPCTAVLQEVEYEEVDRGNRQERFLVCETPSGNGYTVPSASEDWINEKMQSGDLKSGKTELVLPEDAEVDETTAELILDGPPGLKRAPGQNKNNRRLAVTSGDKTVLVVRVISADSQCGFTESELADSVFGDNGDLVNLKSQYTACSHGKINMIKKEGVSITNGVVTVTSTTDFSTVNSNVAKNKVCGALKAAFGVSYPCAKTVAGGAMADHIMMCMPPTIPGAAIAWANVDHTLSVYKNQWINYVSAQMHEIGHNLNLAHAGEDGNQYADQTGMMGFSYGQSDTKMCFNAFNYWQLQWFQDNGAVAVNPVTNPVYEETLSSFVNYGPPSNPVVLIKINNQNSAIDHYMVYNADTGCNDGTKEGQNQVAIVSGGGEGDPEYYGQSDLVAKLSASQTFTLSDFAGSGDDLVVTVNSISTTEANVRIQLGCGRANGAVCSADDQCCISSCTNGACCSASGASCSSDDDCCSSKCKNGTCRGNRRQLGGVPIF